MENSNIKIWDDLSQMDVSVAENIGSDAPTHKPIPRTRQSLIEEFERMKQWKAFRLLFPDNDVEKWVSTVTAEGGSYTLIYD
ncbi:hypothetical protein [Neisseria dumasiana]|uniref:Uncharacterized protein n=1 Tax=Neisseria dumasiana TaxID=1931275 RepID=A0A1X3DIT4_9NEIS|nr:hypothetical protein [Neisseria dumasiana]OSI21676.1 hypothetical protein BV912_06400 [Neisseria dumasiana]